jgi:diaminohydroxyphosphoribosylaminopyrimidine deaminase/5-amino-6-(5-phosphoribosylamino)uracil reductase
MSAAEARDEEMMRLALRMASRGDGSTHPNPSVGAVVYRGGRILGRGTTRPPGGPHAEVVALDAALRKHGARALRGASLAVTLEPCSFSGRTGPCTEAVLAAGIGRVVAGVRDPHPRVSGRGLQQLRRRGVEVATGVLEAECRWQHRGFFSVCERGRPHVTLKLATSLDGRIALRNGQSRWITSAPARAFVHRLRAGQDAILVGSETALADDPELTVRKGNRVQRRPIRVLLDARLRVPTTARLFEPPEDPRTWVLCCERARGIRRVRERAERVLELPAGEGHHVDLVAAFRALAREGLTTVLVEGGGMLASALLRADLIDEVHWLLAPKLIGSDGKPGLGPLGLEQLADCVDLGTMQSRRRGPDLHLHGVVRRSTLAADGRRRQRKGSKG